MTFKFTGEYHGGHRGDAVENCKIDAKKGEEKKKTKKEENDESSRWRREP